MMGFWQTEVFLFKFTLQVGVVTICSAGIKVLFQMLMSTSLWVNLVTQDPEINIWIKAVHWTLLSVFDVSGLGIYTLGMIAAYTDSYRLANVSFILLTLHGFLWLLLTILSFGNWAPINRAVCIDNRCADMLFIQNANWRIAFDRECQNPSMERWLESAGHSSGEDIEEEDVSNTRRPILDAPDNILSIYGDNYDAVTMNLSTTSSSQDGALQKQAKIANLPTARVNVSLLEQHLGTLTKSTTVEKPWWRKTDVLWKSSAKYNKTLVHTPIGYIGCNAAPHIVFSAVCALLILGFWYIYPIVVVRSYAVLLKEKIERLTIEEL